MSKRPYNANTPSPKRAVSIEIYLATEERAREIGRLVTVRFWAENPTRRYYCRPAIQGEFRTPSAQSFPAALVCAHLVGLEYPSFVQRVIAVSRETVEAFRSDHGEHAARALYEVAADHPALQRDELLAVLPGGEIEELGTRRIAA